MTLNECAGSRLFRRQDFQCPLVPHQFAGFPPPWFSDGRTGFISLIAHGLPRRSRRKSEIRTQSRIGTTAMRFSAAAAAFAQAASAAAKGLNPKDKVRVPILQNLLIETTAGGAITVIGTDGDRRIAASCDAEVEQLGSITVDSRLARWLAALDPSATVRAALTDGRLHVRAGRCTARLECLPETDFPIFYGPGSPDAEGNLTSFQRACAVAGTAAQPFCRSGPGYLGQDRRGIIWDRRLST